MFGFRVRVWGEDKEKRLVSMVKEKRGGVVRKIRVANCLRQIGRLSCQRVTKLKATVNFGFQKMIENFSNLTVILLYKTFY